MDKSTFNKLADDFLRSSVKCMVSATTICDQFDLEVKQMRDLSESLSYIIRRLVMTRAGLWERMKGEKYHD